MFRHSTAKLILVFFWAALLVLSALAVRDAVHEWKGYLTAQRILRLAQADRVLFTASADVRFEVGTHGVALLSMDDPTERLAQSAFKVDGVYQQVRAAMDTVSLPEHERLVAAIEGAYANLVHRRLLVQEAMELPREMRDVATIEPWRHAVFALAQSFTDASLAMGNALRMMDTTVADLVLVRQSSYAIRDRYGKPCSDLRREVQLNQPLDIRALSRWREDVGAYVARWRELDDHLRRTGAPPILVEDVAEGRAKTQEIQHQMDRVLYGLGRSSGPAMPAAEWSALCVSAYPSILKVGYDALDLAVEHAARQKQSALAGLWGALAILIAVLALAAASIAIVRQRLTMPLTGLMSAMARLSRLDFSQPVPPARFPDELGAMADALERLRRGALEAEQLQLRLDESRQAEIEKASQASRAKSAFLATMSHEVRTPLNGILGMVQLLQGSPLSAQQRQWLEAISHSGTLLLAILNDILDYSKIEAGRLELEHIAFNPRELVETVVATMEPQAQARQIAFPARLPRNLPAMVQGDPAKLSQILLNLVGNAIKFTTEGSVTLSVRRLQPAPRDGWVRLEFKVADTGIGIAPKAQEHLFEAFTQSDSSITRRFGGTGLGLAICKRIVDAMGGSIQVESDLGKGSTFTLVLDYPLARRPKPRSGKATEDAEPMPPLSILLADDNEVNAMVATAMLEQMGHSVTLASDGETAADLAAQHDFDMVMMDLAMPRLDGLSATRRIRALPHATRSQVPVIALTANVSAQVRGECGAAGMNGFLGKPFRRHELIRAIADAIGLEVKLPAEESPPVVAGDPDRHLLAERARDIGAQRAGRVVTVFVETTPGLVAEMAAAVAAGDVHRAGDCAHRLKGAAGHLGLVALADTASEVERAARDRDQDRLAQTAAQLQDRLPSDIEALKQAWNEIVTQLARRTDSPPHVP